MSNDNKKKDMTSPKDLDKDGIVSEREVELEIKLEKAESQMRIAMTALASMIIMALYVVSPYGPSEDMLFALDTTLSTFFIAMASIVGAYMGFTAWLSKS